MKDAAIVYQGGIANVFEMDRTGLPMIRPIRRLEQGAFVTCENVTRGLMLAGVSVRIYSCNMAGDVTDQDWTQGLSDCPFREDANPPTV